MKTFITLLLTIATLTGFSQNKANLMISQDARLAILGDDKGNEAFTPNLRLRSEWQANQLRHGYFFGAPEIEYADLQRKFVRTSLNFGFTHNMFSRYFEVSYSVGYGIIARETDRGWYSTNNFGADVYLTVKASKKIHIFINGQLLQRNDLRKEKVIYSNFVGVKINF